MSRPRINPAFRSLFLYWAPLLGYLAIIFSLSASSEPTLGHPLPVSDKLVHFFEFGLLAFLFIRAFRSLENKTFFYRNALWLGILFSVLYAGSDEWHQSYVAMRESSLADFLADTLGILAAAACCHWRR